MEEEARDGDWNNGSRLLFPAVTSPVHLTCAIKVGINRPAAIRVAIKFAVTSASTKEVLVHRATRRPRPGAN